jgi:hypothetical protein
MKFLTVILLLGSLTGCHAGDDTTARQIVGTWLIRGRSGSSITYSADGSFITSIESTNHTVTLTYQGTWQVKDREVMLTSSNVAGSIPHEPVGSVDRYKILELDSHHMKFSYQAATNYVATNTVVRKP